MAATQEEPQEDASQGLLDSARYVARTLVDHVHYSSIHNVLRSRWDRLHSLSAAVKLMETYGVVLSQEEQDSLSKMDEGQQINALVGRMPQQSNEQFQHFFLQLQLLVTTALRVRHGLEEGRPEEVAEALEIAASSGVASHILRVAIVQAGNEVASLKNQFNGWVAAADAKMGRLIRGQQDAVTAQKKLAAAQAELARHTGLQLAKCSKSAVAFADGNDAAVRKIVFQAWHDTVKVLRMEATIRLEYKDRLESLSNNTRRWKMQQLQSTLSIVGRQIKDDRAAVCQDALEIWRAEVEEAKFMRENNEKVSSLERKLVTMKTKQLANTTSAMARAANQLDRSSMELGFKAWCHFHREVAKEKEMFEAEKAAEQSIVKFARGRRGGAKKILESMTGATDTGLLFVSFQAWYSERGLSKQEGVAERELMRTKTQLAKFKEDQKSKTLRIMEHAIDHLATMIMVKCLTSWRLDARMERSMRVHHAKLDAKRQQLTGVQHMFRTFAQQLETGLKESADSTRTFETLAREGRRPASQGPVVPLPAINGKASTAGQASGRSSSKSATTPHKSVSQAGAPAAPEASPTAAPRPAWG